MRNVEILELAEFDPDGYIKDNSYTYMMFLDFIISMMNDSGVETSMAYPEEYNKCIVEVISRSPAVLESKTIKNENTVFKPMHFKQVTNINTGEVVDFYSKYYDNEIEIGIYGNNAIDSERIANSIELILSINYGRIKTVIDSFYYQGRRKPVIYNLNQNKKTYNITLVYKFRTKEIEYVKSEAIRDLTFYVEQKREDYSN